jgi:hypothetical protein
VPGLEPALLPVDLRRSHGGDARRFRVPASPYGSGRSGGAPLKLYGKLSQLAELVLCPVAFSPEPPSLKSCDDEVGDAEHEKADAHEPPPVGLAEIGARYQPQRAEHEIGDTKPGRGPRPPTVLVHESGTGHRAIVHRHRPRSSRAVR